MTEKIMTLHPDPDKAGVNIDRQKYELIRGAILDVLRDRPAMPFAELSDAVAGRLPGRFDGSIPWYTVTVKLDLEARGLIQRLDGAGPQRLSLTERGRQET